MIESGNPSRGGKKPPWLQISVDLVVQIRDDIEPEDCSSPWNGHDTLTLGNRTLSSTNQV